RSARRIGSRRERARGGPASFAGHLLERGALRLLDDRVANKLTLADPFASAGEIDEIPLGWSNANRGGHHRFFCVSASHEPPPPEKEKRRHRLSSASDGATGGHSASHIEPGRFSGGPREARENFRETSSLPVQHEGTIPLQTIRRISLSWTDSVIIAL